MQDVYNCNHHIWLTFSMNHSNRERVKAEDKKIAIPLMTGRRVEVGGWRGGRGGRGGGILSAKRIFEILINISRKIHKIRLF